jgi:hypothetical protein
MQMTLILDIQDGRGEGLGEPAADFLYPIHGFGVNRCSAGNP